MRDILTALAFLVILVLTAALVAPPLIAWEDHRGELDRALTRAAGTPVATHGAVSVRLLPSPRIRVDGVRIGPQDAAEPSLTAGNVTAEIELGSLVRGEVRLTGTRLGHADLALPTGAGEGFGLPGGAVPGEGGPRWGFEDLRTDELRVATVSPVTGTIERLVARDVTMSSQGLGGPWRIEGTASGLPFRLVTGRIDADGVMQAKLAAGGDGPLRLEVDTLVDFSFREGAMTPALSGSGRIVAIPPAAPSGQQTPPAPLVAQANFNSEGEGIRFADMTIETGEPVSGLRLTGGGLLNLVEPSIRLDLEGRRLALDGFLASPAGRMIRDAAAGMDGAAPMPLDLRLALASIGYGDEELAGFDLQAVFARDSARVRHFSLGLPGRTELTFTGDVGLGSDRQISGQARLASQESDRLARLLHRVGIQGPWTALLDGQPLDVTADVILRPAVASLRNLRIRAGDAVLTGAMRYNEADGPGRGRFEAQIAAQGVDVAHLPRLQGLFAMPAGIDLGLTIDARDVRLEGRDGAGRIRARLASQGTSLIVETLDIENLAGANAKVSGRLEPNGAGRIAGRVTAAEAAPLLQLLERVWIDGIARQVPTFIRDGALDLELVAESAAPARGVAAATLRTVLKGTVAGGPLAAELLTTNGRPDEVSATLSTPDTRRWIAVDHPLIVGRPSSISIKGSRIDADRFSANASADMAGLRLATVRPLVMRLGSQIPEAGEISVATADLRPAVALLRGGVVSDSPVGADLRLSIRREGDESLLSVDGRVAADPVRARMSLREDGPVSGEASLRALSLPWAVQMLALGDVPDLPPGRVWPSAELAPMPRPLDPGSLTLAVERLDLGRGHVVRGARLVLEIRQDGVAIRDLEGALGDGRLAAELVVRRHEAGASLVGEAALADIGLGELIGRSPFSGRMTGTLQFGSSGASVAELVGNLAGGGEIAIAGLTIENADPQAIERGLVRALRDDDPLGGNRLQTFVEEELDRGPFEAPQAVAQATIVGGVLRLGSLDVPLGGERWTGVAAFDLRDLTLDARGMLQAEAGPRGWTGSPPIVALGWIGPLPDARRVVDVGPLTNGLASIVLQRELERIEAFEQEANERTRRFEQSRMNRVRRENAAIWAESEERRRAEEEARAAQEAAEEARRQTLEAEARRIAEEEQLRIEQARRAEAEREALRRRIFEIQQENGQNLPVPRSPASGG